MMKEVKERILVFSFSLEVSCNVMIQAVIDTSVARAKRCKSLKT